MVEKVNDKLSKEEQFVAPGWYYPKPYGFIVNTEGSTRIGTFF